MSRKNRQRRRSQPVQKQTDQQQKTARIVPLPLLANDGYVNRMAYLGEASLLNEASDYERHSITRDTELLTVMYRENWIAKRIIDTPCEDMTRSWYTISSSLEQDKLDELAQLEAKHNVKQEITNGLRWARLYGGAVAVMVIKGQEDMLDQPLNYDELMPGCFRGLIIVDRTNGLEPSLELEQDMDDPEFGYPKYYDVQINNETSEVVRVHHSRLLIFRGRMLPIMEEISENYWGASELEHVYEELQKRNSTSANIAQLVFQANVGVLKMADYGEIMGMGTETQKARIVESIYAQNRIRNSFGLMIMGNEDGFEQHPYSFSGLSEVYEAFMMDMAGAAEIPATKLYGRSPQGMNATGESDMKNYYEMLAQLQERLLRPAIDKLLPVMCVSLWGKIPNDMEVIFEPLQVTTPAERAQITQQVTGVVVQAFSAGLISQQTALLELQKSGKSIGSWSSITDEIIAEADAETDSGEGMEDPMAGMGGEGEMPPEMAGMMPPGMGAPGMAPEEAPPEEPSQKPQNEPQEAPGPEDDKMLAEILKEAQEGKKTTKKEEEKEPEDAAEDGGPGSGNFNHPGYPRGGGGSQSASIGERLRFIQDPTEGKNAPRPSAKGPTGSKSHVEKMNRERKQWSELTTHQKIQGNAEQQKHIAEMKRQVIKAAAKGDLNKARKIVAANRHYWANDPDSAQKVQSETLKRQMAVKPRRSFLHDALTAVLTLFGRDKWEESKHPRAKNGQFASGGGGGGGSNEKESSSEKTESVKEASKPVASKPETPVKTQEKPADKNGETGYNEGAGSPENGKSVLGWKKLNAAMEVGGPKAAKAYVEKYLTEHPDVEQEVPKYMDVRRKVRDFLTDHPDAENFNTYDAETGEVKNIDSGYCVTFHQNNTETDPLGGYSDRDYAAMCAIAVKELGASSVNIGYYGNPEVSFECRDEKAAKEFAVRHNQESVYNAGTGKTLHNKKYRSDLNPIRL